MNGLCASRVGKAPWCDWPKSTLEVEGIVGLSEMVSNNVLEPWFASNLSVLIISFIFGVFARVSFSICTIASVFSVLMSYIVLLFPDSIEDDLFVSEVKRVNTS